MALLDTYSKNIMRKRNELRKLNESKVKENAKIAAQNQKIHSAKSVISRTKSQTTVKSKLNEIKRAEKEIISINKRIVDFEKKIIQKEREIITENDKLINEEKRLAKKKLELEIKQLKDHERQMKEILNKPTNQYINNGGQMNIANDNATIYATYNHSEDHTLLDALIHQIENADLSEFNNEERVALVDCVDILQEQLSVDEPKKGLIRTSIGVLNGLIFKTAALTEPLQKLIDFAKSYLD